MGALAGLDQPWLYLVDHPVGTDEEERFREWAILSCRKLRLEDLQHLVRYVHSCRSEGYSLVLDDCARWQELFDRQSCATRRRRTRLQFGCSWRRGSGLSVSQRTVAEVSVTVDTNMRRIPCSCQSCPAACEAKPPQVDKM